VKRALAVAAIAAGLSVPAPAQCVMCYRSAAAQNRARSHVMNMGIVLLGAPPMLILAGFIAFVFSKDKIGQGGE
jgi:threonine/homoserine/homoserine lactone efflux protein